MSFRKPPPVFRPSRMSPEGELDPEWGEGYLARSTSEKLPYTCPVCGNRKVVMNGRYEQKASFSFQNGTATGKDVEQKSSLRFLSIDCDQCKVRYTIEPDHIMANRVEIINLNMKIGKLEGKIVVPDQEQIKPN